MAQSHPFAARALFLATLAFAANFSVWTLYVAVVLPVQQSLGLSTTELGVLLATPMLTGALSRVPVGVLADRVDSKRLFVMQMLVCVPPLLLLSYAHSYGELMLLGLWLGLAGSAFTIGVRYVSEFYPRNVQGTALGIFGVGNAGAAITLVVAPWILTHWGFAALGPSYGAGLLLVTVLFALLAPSMPQPSQALAPSLKSSLAAFYGCVKRIHVWRLGLYYYFVFGSFLALMLWLPFYYMQAYQLSLSSAMAFTLFFVATSSVVRALGGWFADKYGGRTVNWSVFWVCLVCLFFLSYPPTTMTIHGVKQDVHLSIAVNLWWFTGLLFVIGIAQGFGRASVYKIINDQYPEQMGTVGGVVAAIGALGGCTLPVIFGVVVDVVGIYSASFMVLYGVLALCMMAMYFAIKAERYQRRVTEANRYNFLEDDEL